ncbi:MAG: insulinase family protein [Gemmatimonadales bacterium]|nr:MAG: insulinase family protein [Gemmatimonadales bacterium]
MPAPCPDRAAPLHVIPTFLALGLSLQLLGAPTQPAPPADALRAPFEADLVVKPSGGPETHVFLRPGSGTVALRLSFPLAESRDEAGAAQILRALAETRMQGMARRIAAQARVVRTAEALVYEVAGPASEIDFLVWILNEGLRQPEADRFNQVRRDQVAEVLRRQETPQGVLAHRIREAAGGSPVPLLGSQVALDRMHSGVVEDLWRRSHGRDRARIVVVGDVDPEVVLASVSDLKLLASSGEARPAVSSAAGQPTMRPEVIRHWVAEAWTMDRPRDARALVAVALLGERLRSGGGDYELGAEVWDIAGRWTLVISGAAYPRTHQAMRTRIPALLGEALSAVSEDAVRTQSARIRGDILLQASTPWGLADLVGQAMDAGLESRSVQMVLDELTRMEADDVRSLLSGLGSRTPLRQEIRP